MQAVARLFAWRRWWPEPLALSNAQKLKAGVAALIAILLTGAVTQLSVGHAPLLVASMGAASVILFVLPASPLAQPWSFVGGHLVSAAIGVACARLIPDVTLAAALAVGLSIVAMATLRCLHPPGGAIALNAVIGGPAIEAMGFSFVVAPVLLNALLMLLVALILNNFWLRHPYPRPLPAPAKPQGTAAPRARSTVTEADIAAALRDHRELLDVTMDDLEHVVNLAELNAHRRRLGDIRCLDVMTRGVSWVAPDTPLADAWKLLKSTGQRVLPVLDADRRVIGMVALSDFIQRLDARDLASLRTRLARRLKRGGGQTVASLMASPVDAVRDIAHVTELIPVLTGAGRHHVPVVDAAGRLAGIVSQSELIAVLYEGALAA
ncbi:HPP family protein [Crenobacter cavernae]|uniref:HPP family protein n=1 Tax=Crenobacter cavernae TaxID=2290923 RepID=A0ABY0FCK5_9NEIS|nr:HPP family protein [Crenobacter cavernae]RXZ43840.1 HPP family protein [Crenobacter cavernae]